MKAFAAVPWSWLSQLARAVPGAWHYDRLFRWIVIAASISLVTLILRPSEQSLTQPTISMPTTTVPAIQSPRADAAASNGRLTSPPSAAVPKIAPGRPLESVVIMPGSPDDFGTVPSNGRR
jgi:hypothetical protein